MEGACIGLPAEAKFKTPTFHGIKILCLTYIYKSVSKTMSVRSKRVFCSVPKCKNNNNLGTNSVQS